MPTPSSESMATHRLLPDDILRRLTSLDVTEKLQALREVKNQIIGNRTKKLSFLKLGAIPAVVEALSQAAEADEADSSLIVQSAAAIGSFACGFDDGVKAVLDAGAFPLLMKLLSHPDDKVVDACARSLKMVYQSKHAPKYEFLQGKKMEFLLWLLHSENENLNGLGLSIIAHSCGNNAEQKTLCDAGVLKKLIDLLEGSISQKDACLESLATLTKTNTEVIEKLVAPECGSALDAIIELTNDKSPRTRLLACSFLTILKNSGPTYVQDAILKRKLVEVLLELVDDATQVGDEAFFILSKLIAEKEDMQKLAYEMGAVDKLCRHFSDDPLSIKRLTGVLRALADLCSMLESCRIELFTLQAFMWITHALTHENVEIFAAACICLKSLSRSVQFVSAGHFMTEKIVKSLVRILQDSSHEVQLAALGAVSNMVIDFASRKSLFTECGGLGQLIELSKSMVSEVRVNSVRALRNLMYHADKKCRERVISDLTPSFVASLINDIEPSVQEQALAMVRNLVDGHISNICFVFADESVVLNAVAKQLENAHVVEVQIQGMCVLTNIASGNEYHKEAVMHIVASVGGSDSITIKFLQSADSRLRTATILTMINLTLPSTSAVETRITKLRRAGIIPQIKTMVNDPCLDVKLRANSVMQQSVMH